MNKKFSTLMASLLLAGGVLSNANAETIANASSNTGQYYYVFVNGTANTSPTTDVTGPIANKTAGVLDSDAEDFWSYEKNESTWWTVETVKETVNGKDVIIGHRLINVMTGEPLSVTVKEDGKDVKYDVLQQNAGALVFVDKKYYKGSDKEFGSSNEGDFWRYSLIPVPNTAWTKDELEKQNGDSFSIQIGYEADEDNDGKNEWHEYASYEGTNVFAGNLYVGTLDKNGNVVSGENVTDGYALYKDANRTQRVVLTENKWEKVSSTLSSGYIFDVLSAEEYNEETNKDEKDDIILADKFIISVPSTVKGEPIEVVATDGTNKYELVVSVVKNAAGKDVNRLTVADAMTKNTADYNLKNEGNTYVNLSSI